MADKLSDFEKIEYYKARLKAKTGYTVVMSVLMFMLGFFTPSPIFNKKLPPY